MCLLKRFMDPDLKAKQMFTTKSFGQDFLNLRASNLAFSKHVEDISKLSGLHPQEQKQQTKPTLQTQCFHKKPSQDKRSKHENTEVKRDTGRTTVSTTLTEKHSLHLSMHPQCLHIHG